LPAQAVAEFVVAHHQVDKTAVLRAGHVDLAQGARLAGP
jgi:hypothetical protein